jgi:urea carboxylase
MCVYGMEGPGGYQLFGRTCQVWNPYHTTLQFPPGKPWLLRFFDQIQFYPVSGEDLLAFRDGFMQGRVHLDIEDTSFSLKEYLQFLSDNADAIAKFKLVQQAAFDEERGRWQSSDREGVAVEAATAPDEEENTIAEGDVAVQSPVPGSVWKIAIRPGQRVAAGDTLIIVESMKMEMTVPAPEPGIVREIRCAEGRPVVLGQTLVVIGCEEAEAAQ